MKRLKLIQALLAVAMLVALAFKNDIAAFASLAIFFAIGVVRMVFKKD